MTLLLLALALATPVQRPLVELELSGQCGQVHVAVYGSGVVHFDESDSCDAYLHGFKSRLGQLSKTELAELKAAIRDARVGTLPHAIEPDPTVVVTDEDVLTLRVRDEDIVREIRAFGLDRAVDKQAAKRFKRLWDAVAKFGPETH